MNIHDILNKQREYFQSGATLHTHAHEHIHSHTHSHTHDGLENHDHAHP